MPLVEGYNKLKSKAEQIVKSVKTSKLLSQKKDAPLPYADPCDNYMDSILSNGLVRKTLQVFADKYCKEQIQKIKSSGQLVSKANYPQFYDILQSCYKSLNIEEDLEVYVTNQLKGINALSVGTDDAPIILISRKAMISLSDGELKFMIKPAEFIHPEDAAALRQLESIPGFPVVAKKIVVLGFEQLRS